MKPTLRDYQFNPDFDEFQLDIIKQGIDDNLDVTLFNSSDDGNT